ncbi:CHAT domain-containing protein [Amycolatopsis sp. NPDC058278]|uniref:CHAT domain-containing protein n=1 Tax=Amycolatopsis sp. NPDC058278 TaxID=3346417 RepID=UPI0036D91400
MPATISDFIDRIYERIACGSAEDVLREDAVRELWAMAALCQVTTFEDLVQVHPSVAHAAASLCWARYLALPEEAGLHDLDRALAGFGACFDPATTVAPVWVREYLLRTADTEDSSQVRLFSGAVLRARRELADSAAGSARHFAATCRLQEWLCGRGWLTTSVCDFDEAIALARRDLETYAADADAQSALAIALVKATVMRLIADPSPAADLSYAITIGEAELERLEPDCAAFREQAYFYACAASAQAKATGDAGILARALRWLERGLSSAEGVELLRLQDQIVDLYETRYRLAGQEADLELAIMVSSYTADATARTDALWPARWQQVAELRRTAYLRSGNGEHRDESIRTMREVVSETPEDDPERVHRMSRLAEMLLRRYDDIRGFGELVEATRIYEALLETVPDDDPRRPDFIGNAIGAYAARATREQGAAAFLDRAVALGEDALSTSGSASFETLMNLAEAHVKRAARNAETGSVAADLDHAVELAELAVGKGRTDQEVAVAQGQLSAALLLRYKKGESIEDLDQATDAARRATSVGVPMRRARDFLSLGDCLERGPSPDIAEAISAFRDAATAGAGQGPIRLVAARAWGKVAAREGDFAEAQAGYRVALQLLREVVDERLTWNDRMELLVEYSGLVWDGVAAALRNNDLDAAVRMVDSGRSVLWTGLTEARREEALLERLAPQLARRYRECLETLDAYQEMDASEATRSYRDQLHAMATLMWRTAEHGHHPADVATAARQERDALRRRMRSMPEFADFDREVSLATVAECLRGRANRSSEYTSESVVIINASRWGCDAILITAGDARRLPLAVTVEEIVGVAGDMWHAMSQILGEEPADGEHDPRVRFQSVLGWLWQRIAEPILHELQFTETPADTARWPRVHWCTSGIFTLLPVHAAEGADGAVIDRVVSTYLVNLGDFSSDQSAHSSPSLPAVGIAVPELPDADALKCARQEVAVVARSFGWRFETLAGEDAQLYQVIQALRQTGSAHFACHGTPAGADANRWGIHLYNGPLTMAKIAELDLSRMRLAYLAACWTGSAGSALDEAANVAAAFRAAGVQHVIAGLWFIGDKHSLELAEEFYPRACQAGEVDAAKVPIALHQAVRVLRDRHRRPWMWAQYVHVGR